MCNLFDSSQNKQEQQQSSQTGQSNTQGNLWPQLGDFFNQYLGNASSANVPINGFQTGAAEGQAGVAGSLQPAQSVANSVATNGITPQSIQSFMSPYIANVVNPTLQAQQIQNQQAISSLRGNQASRGALGNNTGSEAAYYAGVQPAQQAQIASLYNTGYGQATGTAAQSAGLQLQGAGTAGSLAGAQTGANATLGNLGQNIWNSNYQNTILPNQFVQGLQGLSGIAGSNTQSSGNSQGTGTSTSTYSPSMWDQGKQILSGGAALLGLFSDGGAVKGKADGGSIEGGMVPFHHADDMVTKVGKAFGALHKMRKMAEGGGVDDKEAEKEAAGKQAYDEAMQQAHKLWPPATIPPPVVRPMTPRHFDFGGDVGLGDWGAGTTVSGPSFGDQISNLGKDMGSVGKAMGSDEKQPPSPGGDSASMLAGSQQALASFLNGVTGANQMHARQGFDDGGDVGPDYSTAPLMGLGLPLADAGVDTMAPFETREVKEVVPTAGTDYTPMPAYRPTAPVEASTPPASSESGGWWKHLLPLSDGVWAGKPMTGWQRGMLALSQVGDFKGVGDYGLGLEEQRLREAAAQRQAAEERRQQTEFETMFPLKTQKLTQDIAQEGARPVQMGQDSLGRPIYGTWNPQTKKYEPVNAGAGNSAESAAVEQGLTGEDYLKALPPQEATLVKKMVNGEIPPPTSFAATKPYWQGMILKAAQYDPSFDFVQWNARNQGNKDFYGGGKSAEMVRSANQTIGHIGDLVGKMDAMHNRGSPMWNAVANPISQKLLGQQGVTGFVLNAHAVADELSKVFKGQGISDTEIREWSKGLNENMSPDQQRESVSTLLGLLNSSLSALEEKRRNSLGPTLSDKKGPLITPHAQEVLDRVQRWVSGGSAPSQTTAPAVPQRPANVPEGSAYSAKLKAWKTPDNQILDETGNPMAP